MISTTTATGLVIGCVGLVFAGVRAWRWYTVLLDELFPEDPYAYPTFDECRHPETVSRPYGMDGRDYEPVYGPDARHAAAYIGDVEVCLACGARRLHVEFDTTPWRPGMPDEEADLDALRVGEHGADLKQPEAAGGRLPAAPSRKEALLPHSR